MLPGLLKKNDAAAAAPLLCFIGIALVTAMPFFAKRLDAAFWLPWLIYCVVFISPLVLLDRILALRPGLAGRQLWWMLGCAGLALLNHQLYPATRLVQFPSSAPDALIEPALALAAGRHPYSVLLPDGAPISPGPGWVLLNAPLTLSGLIYLMAPFYLMLSAGLLAGMAAWRANLYVALLLICVCFFQMSVVAHDLLAFSLAAVALTALLYRSYHNPGWLLLCAVLAAFIATARVPFVLLPILLALCLFKIDRRRALIFAGIAALTGAAIHGFFYAWAETLSLFYQPLHVFGRGARSGTTLYQIATMLLWLLLLIWLYRGWRGADIAAWFRFIWFGMFLPFAAVGVGELFGMAEITLAAFGNWEGKGYVFFTTPLLAAALACGWPQNKTAGLARR